jgi:hypothetical protein
MKKALLLGMLLCLLFAGRALAAYNFSINASGGTINATLSGATNSTSSFHLVVQTTNNFPTTPPASLQPITNSFDATGQTIQKPNAQGVVTWNLSGTPGTTYYARVVEIPTPANYVTVNQSASPSYVTAVQSVTPAYLPVPINPLTSKLDGTNIIVSGSIDTTKVSFDPTQYTATLVYTPTVPASTVTTLTGTPAGPAKIAADGTYSWTLIGLNPNTTYYFQQTVTQVGNTNNPTVDTINHFNTATGNTVQGTSPSAAETAQESYTFLSDPTGATIFPDPDLCAQEQQQAQANGKTPPKCGLNDYLNLALSFLIGLSGVVLVLKLMWVGFEYMTTDLPFKKAGAKGQFITSLLGLLLVMTSYIILNTINPKLVNEQVNVQQLSIVNDTDTDPTPILQNPVGTPTSGSAGKCINGLTSVKVQQTTFVVCSSYTPPAGSAALLVNVNSSGAIPVAQNLQAMLTAAANAGLVLGGGGYRSAAQQTKLRTQNCNGDLTNPQAVCSPPTAPVGQSNHESGLAFDFKCNGSNQAIQNHSDPCYVWLNANAATYGFKNYPVEPWHWSIDGH